MEAGYARPELWTPNLSASDPQNVGGGLYAVWRAARTDREELERILDENIQEAPAGLSGLAGVPVLVIVGASAVAVAWALYGIASRTTEYERRMLDLYEAGDIPADSLPDVGGGIVGETRQLVTVLALTGAGYVAWQAWRGR
jgi:hypothetical protein